MARPSNFTPERRKVILDGLRAGLTRTAAAARAEIDLRTLERWCASYVGFCRDVIRAEGEAESRFTGVIAQAANPHDVVETTTTEGPDGTVTKTVIRREFDWRAAESWLKRRRRKDWGDNQDITGKLDVGIMSVDNCTAEELRRRLADAAQALLPAGPDALREARTEGDLVGEAD